MKVYTVKDDAGVLYPKAILEIELLGQKVQDGQVVDVDYGLETVLNYVKKHQEFQLAVCNLELINK